MAQRNPMNQRYQGDGPGGQTRKSASSAKPTSQAAASVYVPKKPTTAAEKRAAEKQRRKQMEEKASERAKRAEERAQQAEEEAAQAKAAALGIDVSELPEEKPEKVKPQEKPKFFSANANPMTAALNANAEYRKWRRVYWVLLGIGIVCVVLSFLFQNTFKNTMAFMYTMVPAYICIIAAFVIDFRKVKPHVKAYQAGSQGGKSPKQIKHEQEALAQAKELEAARKAAKGAKRAGVRGDSEAGQSETNGDQGNIKVTKVRAGKADASASLAQASGAADSQAEVSIAGADPTDDGPTGVNSAAEPQGFSIADVSVVDDFKLPEEPRKID
ncbi:MAG: hypothetical protein LBH87_00835 [Coriobacteriales bacterium]|jgi:hypothetical protein|nr:hypothetical protein [Coriobacteriales bacterium]